jgi:hypothetical protein
MAKSEQGIPVPGATLSLALTRLLLLAGSHRSHISPELDESLKELLAAFHAFIRHDNLRSKEALDKLTLTTHQRDQEYAENRIFWKFLEQVAGITREHDLHELLYPTLEETIGKLKANDPDGWPVERSERWRQMFGEE